MSEWSGGLRRGVYCGGKDRQFEVLCDAIMFDNVTGANFAMFVRKWRVGWAAVEVGGIRKRAKIMEFLLFDNVDHADYFRWFFRRG